MRKQSTLQAYKWVAVSGLVVGGPGTASGDVSRPCGLACLGIRRAAAPGWARGAGGAKCWSRPALPVLPRPCPVTPPEKVLGVALGARSRLLPRVPRRAADRLRSPPRLQPGDAELLPRPLAASARASPCRSAPCASLRARRLVALFPGIRSAASALPLLRFGRWRTLARLSPLLASSSPLRGRGIPWPRPCRGRLCFAPAPGGRAALGHSSVDVQ